MKKIFTFLAALCLTSLLAQSQCVPDTSITHNQPGVYPDQVTNLPHAIVGIPYQTTIQMKVLTDTTIGIPITIDAITVNTVTGLPPGYSYTCTPANCIFPGGSDACVLLQGPAPVPNQVGMVYTIHVEVTASGHITGTGTAVPDQNQSIDYYFIQVDDNVGIISLNKDKFDVLQNVPNPFHGVSSIQFSSPSSSMITLKVSNMLGKTVSSKTILSKSGINKIMFNAKEFEPGIYFYTLSNGISSVTKRMIVVSE
jgi:hypothetical protein